MTIPSVLRHRHHPQIPQAVVALVAVDMVYNMARRNGPIGVHPSRAVSADQAPVNANFDIAVDVDTTSNGSGSYAAARLAPSKNSGGVVVGQKLTDSIRSECGDHSSLRLLRHGRCAFYPHKFRPNLPPVLGAEVPKGILWGDADPLASEGWACSSDSAAAHREVA